MHIILLDYDYWYINVFISLMMQQVNMELISITLYNLIYTIN